jgi:hypothetical protein
MRWYELMAYSVLAVGAIVAALVFFRILLGRDVPARAPKGAARRASTAPDEGLESPSAPELSVNARLNTLREDVESLTRRLEQLDESVNRRFGTVTARMRADARSAPTDDSDDSAQGALPFAVPQRREVAAASPNGASRRPLIPRR